MKIIYLLPPSEGKNTSIENVASSSPYKGEELRWGLSVKEKLSFSFEKPTKIAKNATQKDLKCTGKRYEEGREMNKNIENWETMGAIYRYSWVMYSVIAYENMNQKWKAYFNEHFLILSGMYGILKPQDRIGNYKLPIETKWLREFWWEKITDSLNMTDADVIVDLLPGAYKKMINWKNITSQIVKIDFYSWSKNNLKKLTHGVKKVKWEFVKKLCEAWYTTLEDFPWEKVQISENEYHISVII